MFAILRYIFVGLIAVVLIIVIKKKHIQLKNGVKVILVILLLGLLEISSFIPFENLFVSFPSPEAVFRYTEKGKIINITEGEKSSLVFFDLGDKKQSITPCETVVLKTDAGYKLGIAFSLTTVFKLEKNHSPFIEILRCRNTDDYYVSVYAEVNGESIDISDSLGSEFNRFFLKTEGFDTTSVWCCAYVKNMGAKYQLTIDGEIVNIMVPQK